jgi:hypothetical protein
MSIDWNRDVSKAGCTEPPSKKCNEGSAHSHLLPNLTYSYFKSNNFGDSEMIRRRYKTGIVTAGSGGELVGICLSHKWLTIGPNDGSDDGNWGKV